MIRAVAITGPTASGKTALSLALASRFAGEIVSCDSMQIYRGMDIGTAKATAAERACVPHHLIDILPPTEPYSACRYAADATACAEQIAARGHLPIFVGGTGLYLDTLMRGAAPQTPESDPAYIERYRTLAATPQGADAIWQRLMQVDPISAAAIHKNNVRRVIRALEIYDATGRPKSVWDAESRKQTGALDVFVLTLDMHDRDLLYRRVDARVDEMVRMGLLNEVRALYEGGLLLPDTTASQAIGYKEFLTYLSGACDLGEAILELKRSSRRYAKRQLTWFRRVGTEGRIFLDTESGELRTAADVLDDATERICRVCNITMKTE